MIRLERLERLGPRHADAILAGQDARLAGEIAGERWSRASLDAFLARAARWRADGPIREFAAVAGGAVDGGAADGGAADGGAADGGAADGRAEDRRAEDRRAEGTDCTLLGGGGLNLLDPGIERGQAALTYWILARHRGHGHGHDLAAALVAQARADPRLTELVLRIAPDNDASRALARGLGARRTGELERHPADATRPVERWTLDLRER